MSSGYWSSIINGGWISLSTFGLYNIWGWEPLLNWVWGLTAICWIVLGWAFIFETIFERFLSNKVISSIFWASFLVFEEEPPSLAFIFLSYFSTLALILVDVDLLASTSMAFVYMYSKVLDALSLSITAKSSSNTLENLTLAIATSGLKSGGILW